MYQTWVFSWYGGIEGRLKRTWSNLSPGILTLYANSCSPKLLMSVMTPFEAMIGLHAFIIIVTSSLRGRPGLVRQNNSYNGII
jgi:hypothetical protein